MAGRTQYDLGRSNAGGGEGTRARPLESHVRRPIHADAHSMLRSVRSRSECGIVKAEGLGGPAVDHQLDLRGLLDRKLGGLILPPRPMAMHVSKSAFPAGPCTRSAANSTRRWGPVAPRPHAAGRTSVKFDAGACVADAISATYCMTSSALDSNGCGMVRPIDLAALRLITKANFVGCSTGRSAGLTPFKILSTNTAARRHISMRSAL